jgi:catechol 2,3-dioxygenase
MSITGDRTRITLPTTTTVGQVRLRVADLARSLAFYRDLLGFEHVEREGAIARIGVGPSELPLFELREVAGVRPAPRSAAGLYHAAILLPERADLARAARHLLDNRYPFGQSDHAVSEALYLDDPDGNGLEIYADRPRESWPMAGSEVRMTLDPIDFADLFGELQGDADRWDAMPAGTTIGHIHLRVSDLEAARSFYVGRLGFDVMQDGLPGALFVSAGGYHHHIGMNVWESRGRPLAPEDAAGLDAFEVVLPDRESWEAVLVRLGVDVDGSGAVEIADPDGIRVELRVPR